MKPGWKAASVVLATSEEYAQAVAQAQENGREVERLLEENKRLSTLLDQALAECGQMHELLRDVLRGWTPPARN